MLARIGKIFLIVALTAAIGGHWVVLQSVAWTTMLAGNLRGYSLSQAVERTFDGKHPCALCKQISAGKKSEKKADFPLQVQKLEFTHAASAFVFSPPSDFRLAGESFGSLKSLNNAPPLPPPRQLLG